MGKKRSKSDDGKRKKSKYNPHQIVEPWWSGVYVTCVRGKEKFCKGKVLDMFKAYAEEMYGDLDNIEDNEEEEDSSDKKDDVEDIDDAIAKELKSLQPNKKKDIISAIDLDVDCVFFVRMRKPIKVNEFVVKLCEDMKEGKVPLAKFAQRITPVELTTTANLEGLKRLKPVIASHFHREDDQKPLKFAIRPSIRNHNDLDRDTIIQTVAGMVGNTEDDDKKDFGHSVDLKNYDRMVLVECFRSSIGISVVDKFDSLYRFNLERLHQEAGEESAAKP